MSYNDFYLEALADNILNSEAENRLYKKQLLIELRRAFELGRKQGIAESEANWWQALDTDKEWLSYNGADDAKK